MKLKVTVYRNHFVLEVIRENISDNDPDLFINSTVMPPCILLDNPKENLGMSMEAAVLMGAIPTRDIFMADFDSFVNDEGVNVFAFIGGPCSVKPLKDVKLNQGFKVPEYTQIPNDSTSRNAIEMIDEWMDKPENFTVISAGPAVGFIRKQDLDKIRFSVVPNDSTVH